MNFETTPGWTMSRREPQVILKTTSAATVLELGHEGKFTAKSCGWGENRVSLRATSSRLRSSRGAGMFTHLRAGPRPAEPYFDTEE
jgi:hypothetical protein